MASTFAYGTGSAAPIAASAGSRRRIAAAALLIAGLTAAAPPPARLDVEVAGLRSPRGNLLICLTRDPTHFPDCSGDPLALKATVTASSHAAHFDNVAPGGYALSLVHDENGNGRLDTRMGIPREGIAFSNNPRLFFGPPRFSAVRFDVTGTTGETVQMKYFL